VLLNLLNIVLLLLPGPDINPVISNYLETQLKNYEKFEYVIVNEPKDYSKITIDNTRDFKLSGSTGYIPVTLHRKTGRSSASYISVKLTIYDYVLVALNDVKKGETLNAKDFDFQLTDVSRVNGTLLELSSNIETFRAKFTIKENSILVREMLDSVPVIGVGDRIKANAVSGSVVISTDAFARQEGGIGDIIIIRTADNKQFRAEIVDRINVLIIE